jgi:acetyl/propionyl-CoA carboxylase alpha subunit/acetyl-CoA carboxylase carboxyltransferase component
MTLTRLLVANRGEIAVRILRAAAELGIETVAVYSEDDAESLHTRRADQAIALQGTGAAAYLDIAQIVSVAQTAGCDAIHPGYGFLSENAAFARACAAARLTFVGPSPETLALFGDKAQARALAERLGVPLLAGTSEATGLEEAHAFLDSLGEGGAIMVKAIGGGGGRGIRAVRTPAELDAAYARCQSEAKSAFGNGDLYVERLLTNARHIEVQVVGDGSGEVTHLWERECTIQRRNQKLVEIAPGRSISPRLRDFLTQAALRMAREVHYSSLGTFEFLVDATHAEAPGDTTPTFAFIEANARLQVEHTITEEVTGIDLVQAQLRLAGGCTLADLGLLQAAVPPPNGFAIQLRVNMERMTPTGTTLPGGGRLAVFEPPSGPGVRVDSFGYAGYSTSPHFDSLLAKVIVHNPSDDFAATARRASRALAEFRVEGVSTNIAFLQNLLRNPEFLADRISTTFVEEHIAELAAPLGGEGAEPRPLFCEHQPAAAANAAPPKPAPAVPQAPGLAGARIDASDPLAVLHHGKADSAESTGMAPELQDLPPGVNAIRAPLQGTIVGIDVHEGDLVRAGQQLLVMEAMKMEHVIAAEVSGRVQRLAVSIGDAVFAGHVVALVEAADVAATAAAGVSGEDLDNIRPDLAEVHARHAIGLDAARPDAVARRRKTGQRTARENIEQLCDEGSFVEYGPLVIAAQRRRRTLEDLIERTPADGLVAGIGTVNADRFGADRARCIAMSYDYTVLAGTQGSQNHRKKDRMFEIAEKWRLPVVFFTEGGGGRPGDTDGIGVAGLDCMAFHYFGRLSGLVPLVGIASGRCFAGNAALLGCCDVVIATRGANIGMGGPAMIEGGGLGIFRPEEVGPTDVQSPNGVIDVLVADEQEAVAVAQKYLSYFQGPVADFECVDQRLLRSVIPENRLRVYDVRSVIETLADTGSVLELRRQFGPGMVTAFIRIEGRPVGVVANNPVHLAGAIESDGADKAARFMQLCDAFDIPLLFLCDTPGIMVGPEVEKTALVRHAARMFVTGASVSVPFFTIVLRKSYGLGAQAMAGGSFKAPFFAVSWPTGEFGGMGLEGAVKLGYRNELAAIEDPDKRREAYEEMVARSYERGKAVNIASHFEIDDVIDPIDSRRWVSRTLASVPPPLARSEKKRPCIDTW